MFVHECFCKGSGKKTDEEPTLSLSTLFQFSENHQMSFQRDCHSQSAGVSPKSKKMAKNVKTQFRMKLLFTWCKRQTVKSIIKRGNTTLEKVFYGIPSYRAFKTAELYCLLSVVFSWKNFSLFLLNFSEHLFLYTPLLDAQCICRACSLIQPKQLLNILAFKINFPSLSFVKM